MSEEAKDKNVFKEQINRQNIDKSYMILYVSVFALVVVGEVLLLWLDPGETPLGLLKDTLGNLMGVLAAFLIFDIFHEKMTKDSYAEEMSQNIMGTIMGKPEMIEPFNPEQRREFLYATLTSFTKDKEVSDLLMSNINDYIKGGKSWKIRTEYTYDFELFPKMPKSCDFLSDPDQYFYVQEKLNYKIRCLSDQMAIKEGKFRVGFMFDNGGLDSALREKKSEDDDYSDCIFREGLNLLPKDVEQFKRWAMEGGNKLKEMFEQIFRLDVQIDREQVELASVHVNDKGIFATMKCRHAIENSYVVRIIFYMPKKWDTLIEVVFVDYTHAPKVFISYNEEEMDVEMTPFLSKGEESCAEVAHAKRNGVFDISLNNEWIFPISGMVFMVKRDENMVYNTQV